MKTFEEYRRLLTRVTPSCLQVERGFVENMRVPGRVYISDALLQPLLDELKQWIESGGKTFMPALIQVANAASLPAIVRHSVALPDIHAGYGFAIGNVAAFDMDDPLCPVSPGAIGYDINCGVRMLRTCLTLDASRGRLEALADKLFELVPAGVGARNTSASADNRPPVSDAEIKEIMSRGMAFAVERGTRHTANRVGMGWPEDMECIELRGCLPCENVMKVNQKAKTLGQWQLGTLGSGNHYVEVQAVDAIHDAAAAAAMGITQLGQLCIMIHCGSRGLGHQVASEFIDAMTRSGTAELNDPQLVYAPAASALGRSYLSAMYAAGNFAYVNRSVIAMHVRSAFAQVFGQDARSLDMHLVYDVAHNIASLEEHVVDGRKRRLLVHRKGSTRAFPPGHPELPAKYRATGQPVMVGGSMGTHSYVLTAASADNEDTFATTCHGAGRIQSRTSAKEDPASLGAGLSDLEGLAPGERRKALARATSKAVLDDLRAQGVVVRVSSPEDIAEEGPRAYKDIHEVVSICEEASISRRAFRLKPVCVIKG